MSATRREIICGTAAAVALGRTAVAAAPKRPAGGAILLGLQSYSLRDRPLDEALAGMKQLGVRSCELWQGHIEPKDPAGVGGKDAPAPEAKKAHREALRKWRLEVSLDLFRDVAAKFKAAGIAICAYCYNMKDDFTDAEIERGFDMTKALGVKIMTASANQSTVARIAPVAARRRIRVGLHNHSRLLDNEFARAEDFEKAIAGPGREYVAINFDIGHFAAANFDPVEFLKRHHARIVTLHIKDRKKDQGPAVPFGEGDTPIKQVLTLLRDRRWRIPANLEYEYKGDALVEIAKMIEYCKQAVAA